MTTSPAAVDELLDRVDITDPAWHAGSDPHPVFALLRRHRPVEQRRRRGDGRTFWSVTRHAETAAVFRDPVTFSSEFGLVVDEIRDDGPDPSANRVLQMCGPAAHRRLRPQLLPAYGRRAAGELEGRIRGEVAAAVADVAPRDGFDVATDLAAPLASAVMLGLLGVPERDRAFVRELVELAEVKDPAAEVRPPFRSRAEEARHHLLRYLLQLVGRNAADLPDGHVRTVLACRAADGRPLPRMDVALNVLGLIDAGYGTLRHATSGAVLALVEHPDQADRVRADPALTDGLCEEVARWYCPVVQLSRVTTRRVELGGTSIGAGEIVTIWISSANRDESVFDRPDDFDVSRRPHRHLGYAVGPHLCMGMHLARTHLRVLVDAVLHDLPRLQRAGPVLRMPSNTTAGILALPVAVTGRRD